MNKRLEEFARQADKIWDGASPEDSEWCEKFAELIIKECARIDSEENNPDHEDGKSYNGTILNHFGFKY